MREQACSRWRSLSPPAPAPAQRAAPQPNLDAPAPLQPGDAFGESVTLPERTIIYIKGHSKWDAAFETLVDAFKSLNEYLDKQGIKPDRAGHDDLHRDRRRGLFIRGGLC